MAARGIQEERRGQAEPPFRSRSIGAVAVLVVFFEILHVLEVFIPFVCDAADFLAGARGADALVTRASLAGTCVLLVRANAIVGHGVSFSAGLCDHIDVSKR